MIPACPSLACFFIGQYGGNELFETVCLIIVYVFVLFYICGLTDTLDLSSVV